MSFKVRLMRAFFSGSILLIAQAAPAFAEKVTLKCSNGQGGAIMYFTIDTVAKTMTETANNQVFGTYPAKITNDAVTWISSKMRGTYDRHTGLVSNWMTFNGYTKMYETASCVRAPAAPF